MGSPWMKFYPTDWQADVALRSCSLAARGLWLEMLCIMHNSERYGHLLVNGKVPNDNAIAIICGIPADQLPDLLGELEEVGVFSRSSNGVIYSRRMVADHKKSNVNRKNVKKRWNGEKTAHEQVIDPVDKNPVGNTTRNTKPCTYIPETRNQNNNKYWFEGDVIKLTETDFHKWLELSGQHEEKFWKYLVNRDEWLAKQPPNIQKGWFMSTSKNIQSMEAA